MLANMTIAASAHGLRLAAELFPRELGEGTVARVRFATDSGAVDPLVSAIDRRCVNRYPYRSAAVPVAVRQEIEGLVGAVAGVRLEWVEGPPLARAARVAAHNDRLLFENRALHDGLYRWLRWSAAETARTGDGMPIETLGLHPAEQPGFRLLGAWSVARAMTVLGVTRLLPVRTRLVYRRSGAIALLSVDGRQREDFVRGGDVLERIWLTATLRDLAFQPITGLTFLLLRMSWLAGEGIAPAHRSLLESARRELDALFPAAASRTPIMLFRLGVAARPVARAPRLPLDRILEISL